MPYLEGTNKHFDYAERMKSEDFALLHSNELAGTFQRAIEQLWSRHVYQNAYELVEAMSKSGQFENELADLNNPEPDYQEAALQNNICIVDGSQEAFYFKWDEMTTIEVTAHDNAMIDFQAFAKENGLDLNEWRYDEENDQIVRHDSPRGQLLNHSNALEGFIEYKGGVDGDDVHEFLLQAATAAGLTELAESLEQDDKDTLYEKFINTDYATQTQRNDDVEDAAKNACDEYGIDSDDYRPEVYEHYAIDNDMARALQNQGELVVELAGFQVWGRCTTGQSVVLDHCVQQTFIHEFPYEFQNFVEEHMPAVADRIKAEVRAEYELEQQKKQENAPATPSI